MVSVLATIVAIMVSTVMATVAILRYREHRLGWLFLNVIATRIVLALGNVGLAITSSPDVALAIASLRLVTLWCFGLSMLLFFSALYVPQLWQRRWLVRSVVILYGLAAVLFALDAVLGQRLLIAGVRQIGDRYAQIMYTSLGWVFAYMLNFSWLLHLTVLVYAFVRQPRERASLVVLLVSAIASGTLSGVARGFPAVAPIAPSVSDVLFVAALAYLLFRRRIFETTRVALDFALENIPQGIAVVARDETVLWANAAATHLLGLRVGQSAAAIEMTDPYGQPRPMALAADQMEQIVRARQHTLVMSSTAIRDQQASVQGYLLLIRDVTEAQAAARALQERQRALEQTLGELQQAYAAQHHLIDTVHALSMPIIPVLEGVIVLPLIGVLDAQRRDEFTGRFLHGIEQHRAHTALLDLTGVSSLDHEAAIVLTDAIQSARLLGAQTILVGVRPDIAQALVACNLDTRAVWTSPTLQSALARHFVRSAAT
ncbi:MAG TPA: STAS domain-containing protein [Herpetosiphonaceae bacterium]